MPHSRRGLRWHIDSDLNALHASTIRNAESSCLRKAVAEQIPLPDASLDRIFCSFVFHEVDDLGQTLSDFSRLLKTDGKLLVLEWGKKPMDMGPTLEERIDANFLGEALRRAGFRGTLFRPNELHYGYLAEFEHGE
ncbi:class I SAM-dependent methyltransferase [Alicyclobacillus herbarius]|uniref:class I SAM-dependent methyltransferase n=1 Tax=Alicyclobacillus herbarius TaxID=122960 RepID=UPI003CCC19F5